MQNYAWLLLALPLLGFVVTGGLGRRMSRPLTGAIGSGVIGLAFVVAVIVFFTVRGETAAKSANDLIYYTYLGAGTFHVDLGLYIDPLTCVMLLIVTGVGFLI